MKFILFMVFIVFILINLYKNKDFFYAGGNEGDNEGSNEGGDNVLPQLGSYSLDSSLPPAVIPSLSDFANFINQDRTPRNILENIGDVCPNNNLDGYYKYLGISNEEICPSDKETELTNAEIIKTERFKIVDNGIEEDYIRKYVTHEKTYHFNSCENLLYDKDECHITPCPSDTNINCDVQRNYIFNNILNRQFWSEDGSFDFFMNNRIFNKEGYSEDINVNSSNFVIYIYNLNAYKLTDNITNPSNFTASYGDNFFNFFDNNEEYKLHLPDYYFKKDGICKRTLPPTDIELPSNLNEEGNTIKIEDIHNNILNIFGEVVDGTDTIDTTDEKFKPIVVCFDLIKNCHLIIGISEIDYSHAFDTEKNKITFKLNYQCIYKDNNSIIFDEKYFLKNSNETLNINNFNYVFSLIMGTFQDIINNETGGSENAEFPTLGSMEDAAYKEFFDNISANFIVNKLEIIITKVKEHLNSEDYPNYFPTTRAGIRSLIKITLEGCKYMYRIINIYIDSLERNFKKYTYNNCLLENSDYSGFVYWYILDINTLQYIKSTINSILHNNEISNLDCTENFSNINENFTNYDENKVETFSNRCSDLNVIDSNGNIIPYKDNTFDPPSYGKDCEWYESTGKCANYETTPSYSSVSLNHSGLTASNACCVCGGGDIDNSPISSPSYEDSHNPSPSYILNEESNSLLTFIMVFMGNLNTLSLAERERFIEQIRLFLIEKGMTPNIIPEINLESGSIIVNISLVDNDNSRTLVSSLTTPESDNYISPNNPAIINIGNGKIFTSYKVVVGSQLNRESQESCQERIIIDMGDGNDILQYGTIGNSNIFLPMHNFS